MRHPVAAMAGRPPELTREVVSLVGLVVAVDAAFVAAYFVAGLPRGSDHLKLGFTVCWTVATLAVVLRGLGRVRAARVRGRRT